MPSKWKVTDLKPCPFCGGKNIIHFNNGFFVQVYCVNCKCGTTFFKYEPDCDKTVEAWNRRAEPVKEQPAADVVEVVRCKDCDFSREFRIWEKESGYEGLLKCECNMFGNGMKIVFDEHYCSFGKRKEGDR